MSETQTTPDTPITVDGVTMTAREAANYMAEGCTNAADRIARYLTDAWYAGITANAVSDFRAMGDSVVAHKRANATYRTLQEYHRRRAAEADAKLAEAEKRIGELEAIVGKLPKTADGVPIVPGMTVYEVEDVAVCTGFNFQENAIDGEWWEVLFGNDGFTPASEVYSTREAALASRPGKESEGGK
jgi:hypothetical protein